MQAKFKVKNNKIVGFQTYSDNETPVVGVGEYLCPANYVELYRNSKLIYDSTEDEVREKTTEEFFSKYNSSVLLDWCFDGPLQSAEFSSLPSEIKTQSIGYTVRFADNANVYGVGLYRKAAAALDLLSGTTVPSQLAETIIAQAKTLNANIGE